MSTGAGSNVLITGNWVGSSDLAIKFECQRIGLTDLDESIITWFPLSQTKSHFRDPNTTGQDTITVTEWIARTKGLI